MKRDSLDIFDELPEDMKCYLRYYGRHFNRKLCKFAVNQMYISSLTGELGKTNEVVQLNPIKREELDTLLKKYKVKIDNNQLYDYVYVANMCKADFLGSSITDEEHLCLYVKDVIDDVDAYDGIVFNRWYADMCRKGLAIDWEDML